MSVACGGLGDYDRNRVQAIAAAIGARTMAAYDDGRAALHLDREPVVWEHRHRRGMAWSERPGAVSGEQFRSWQDAATDGAACGLCIDGRSRYIHTGISGAAPLYFIADAGALYFATRIDPLVVTSTTRLNPDWDAWASLLTLGYPLGDRTPFAEVRRLGAFATLRCRRGSSAVEASRWPWAEVEPELGVEDGVGPVLEAMRRAVRTLPGGTLISTLSGGWDSRLLLGLAAEERRGDIRSVTVNMDGGDRREEEIAAAVASHVGVPHESVIGATERFWDDTVKRAAASDYQHVQLPLFMPLAEALRGRPGTALDGLALDVFAQPGGRFITEEAVRCGGTAEADAALLDRLLERHGNAALRALQKPAAEAVVTSAGQQFLAEGERFRGHPASALLTLYATRTVRSVALSTRLRADQPTAAPFTEDAVARALLAISPDAKYGATVYRALFAALDQGLGELPSTNDPAPSGNGRATAPVRKFSSAAIEKYRQTIGDGPLTPYLSARMRRALTGAGSHGWGGLQRATLSVLLFHLWCRRYAGNLGEIDPADGLGLRDAL